MTRRAATLLEGRLGLRLPKGAARKGQGTSGTPHQKSPVWHNSAAALAPNDSRPRTPLREETIAVEVYNMADRTLEIDILEAVHDPGVRQGGIAERSRRLEQGSRRTIRGEIKPA